MFESSSVPFSSIEEALQRIKRGEMVVVVDDEHRENEGDLTLAAESVTPEAINFMATHGRGLICVALEGSLLDKLQIPLMVKENSSPFETAFCISVEARSGTTTGISAADRSRTVQTLIDPQSKAYDFVKPGHMFPLRAKPGGVLMRTGQTEASVDLARLAGCHPSGVICEIMNADGTMARLPDLIAFCQKHHLLIVTVADLVAYRLSKEPLVKYLKIENIKIQELNKKQIDSVKRTTPFCVLTVKETSNKTTQLRCFRIKSKEDVQAGMAEVVDIDRNKFWCQLPNGELVKCQYFVFNPLFLGHIYFPMDLTGVKTHDGMLDIDDVNN